MCASQSGRSLCLRIRDVLATGTNTSHFFSSEDAMLAEAHRNLYVGRHAEAFPVFLIELLQVSLNFTQGDIWIGHTLSPFDW